MPVSVALICIAGIALLSSICAAQADTSLPAVSRWSHPDSIPRPIHSVPAVDSKCSLFRPVRVLSTQATDAETGTSRICLIIHTNIYTASLPQFEQLEADLISAGYTPITYIYSSGSAADIRLLLKNLYNQSASLSGAVLIGSLPYVLYEMIEDWDGDGPGIPMYADFPSDLYYMDLDGEWTDTTENGAVHAGNGKFDSHTGDTDVEIWVSRIKTDNLQALGTESNLILSYLDKNHRYRTKQLQPDKKGLVYNDDDWSCLAANDAMHLEWLYGASNVTVVSDKELTTGTDYLDNCLSNVFESISIRSHGYFGGHSFYRENRSIKDEIFQRDYDSTNPSALFYSLFICSGSDFSVENNLAGTISFNPDDSGLLCWGSTKTGGMFNESAFYDELSDQASSGDAFIAWFNEMNNRYDSETMEHWLYGMVLTGDASLAPSAHMPEPQSAAVFIICFCLAAYRQHRHP